MNYRRDFLKKILSLSALSAAPLPLMLSASSAAAGLDNQDHRALVCIFLYGGNDSFNMFIPTGAEGDQAQSYQHYAEARGPLTINNHELSLPNLYDHHLGLGTSNPYATDSKKISDAYLNGYYGLADRGIPLGVNAMMPELAQLILSNRASIISNVGTLVEPVSRNDILTEQANLPVFLFAHNHQQRIIQTATADALTSQGWAGRIADLWQSNNDSNIPMNIGYFKNDFLINGALSTPLVLSPGDISSFLRISNSSIPVVAQRRQVYEQIINVNKHSINPFVRLHADLLGQSLGTFDELKSSINGFDLNLKQTNSYGQALFSVPKEEDTAGLKINGNFLAQLKSALKMIALSQSQANESKLKKQIFLIGLGGFDTHKQQLESHPHLLRTLSAGLWDFQQGLEELGLANQVTTITMSDFGRTTRSNGAGCDHGWGGHQIILNGNGSGEVNTLQGGKKFGEMPLLTPGGENDFNNHGRIIPGISQDQLSASVANWLGLSTNYLGSVFPHLMNFRTNNDIRSALINDLYIA